MIKYKAKYGAVLEARMGSTRLPGKTLKNLSNEPMIKRVFDRIRCSSKIDELVLATTINKIDDDLVHFAESQNVSVFRGSEENVLERVVLAAEKFKIENIVELHGDNPFLDPEIIDMIIDEYELTRCDYISNTIEKTFPMGLRVQVFSTESLRNIYDNICDPAVDEHVSLYYYENPDIYKIVNFYAPAEIRNPEIRLTIDTEEDFTFAQDIYTEIFNKNIYPGFKTKNVLDIIKNNNIQLSNKNIVSKPVR